ncbi:MAG: hypothetical protein K940chlam9_01106 [Chlamydiae bacterium]|nr:hypothetical protein [Chlamydiota bacterium]
MFDLQWTEEAERVYRELDTQANEIKGKREKKQKSKYSKQESLFKQVKKTLKHLQENPRHPGLETHPYSSLEHPWDFSQKVFEASAQNNTPAAYRVFWCYGPDKKQITIIAITAHP